MDDNFLSYLLPVYFIYLAFVSVIFDHLFAESIFPNESL
jgi:hypothetical protein